MRTFYILLICLQILCSSALSHDLWLAVKWSSGANRLNIRALLSEGFPEGNPVTDRTRFVEPRAWVAGMESSALVADPADSSLLGSVAGNQAIVATTVRPREVTFGPELAGHYFEDEIGMTREEASEALTPGVEEFKETYTRYLKTIAFGKSFSPRDSLIGLPLEILVTSWKTEEDFTMIGFRVFNRGTSVSNAPLRLLTPEGVNLIRTDPEGNGRVEVSSSGPVLLAYIHLTKLSEDTFSSEWTNLAIYPLKF